MTAMMEHSFPESDFTSAESLPVRNLRFSQRWRFKSWSAGFYTVSWCVRISTFRSVMFPPSSGRSVLKMELIGSAETSVGSLHGIRTQKTKTWSFKS